MIYKAILLDWGGVISPGGTPDEVSVRLGQVLNISPSNAAALINPYTSLLKRGKISIDEFWDSLQEDINRFIPVSERNVWTDVHDMAPHKPITAFVDELLQSGYKIGILSNTFPNTADDIRNQGWYDNYSPVLLSSDRGFAKPDIEFYNLALQELGCTAEETIFIDDQERCLAPARKMGITTILATSPDQITADIRSLLM